MLSIKIKNARESFGWTQRALADKAGLSSGYIGMVESGKINPSLKALNKIAAALNVESSYLIEKKPGILLDQFNDHLTLKEKEFISQQKNRPWVTLASDLAGEGISPEEIKDLMKTIMKVKGKNKNK